MGKPAGVGTYRATATAIVIGLALVLGSANLDGGTIDAALDDAPDAPPDAATDVPPDAGLDAATDGPPPISMITPWTRTTVTPSSASLYGADGVAVDSEGCWVTAWEQAGKVTRACRVAGVWQTELVASGLAGLEDAKAADLDGDGTLDVVSCSDGGLRCYVTFRGATHVTTTLTGSMGHNHAMQAAIVDVDGDGRLDIVFGTRFTSTTTAPAVIGWLKNPGEALARTGAAWAYEQMSPAGWAMSVEASGGRIYVSDRSSYRNAAGVTQWDLSGARWLERTETGWVNHRIGPPAGTCPQSNYLCTNVTPGNELFMRVVSETEIWDCQSNSVSQTTSRIRRMRWDGVAWVVTVLPPAANVGHCQNVLVTDVDGDGVLDVVVSGSKGDHPPTDPVIAARSAVYWLRAPTWERGEISGPGGVKFDNVEALGGGCLITSEQVDQLGVVMYCPPGA